MASISIKDQLFHLKAMTERINVVHEAQTLQLRNYPLLIPGVTSAETEVNIEQKIVTFNCKSEKKFRNTKKVQLAIKHILEWTRMVIWTSTTIIIKVNGKEIFDSRT